MLSRSQHLFAEQRFDLVMTSGNVSVQWRRSSELGELAGGGRGGGQSGGKGEKKKQGVEEQSSSCFTTPRNADHRRCMGANDELNQEVAPGGRGGGGS